MTVFAVTALCVFGLDRLLKAVLEGTEAEALPGILRITTVHNTGTAMGLFGQSASMVLILLAAVVMALLFFAARGRASSPVSRAALGAIFGGALGNLWDRLFLGYVIDLFDFEFVRFFFFFFADAAIIAGCVLCGLTLLFAEDRCWKGKDLDKNDQKNG